MGCTAGGLPDVALDSALASGRFQTAMRNLNSAGVSIDDMQTLQKAFCSLKPSDRDNDWLAPGMIKALHALLDKHQPLSLASDSSAAKMTRCLIDRYLLGLASDRANWVRFVSGFHITRGELNETLPWNTVQASSKLCGAAIFQSAAS